MKKVFGRYRLSGRQTKTASKWGVNIRFTITKNEGFEGEVSICRKRVLKSTKKLRLSYESRSFFLCFYTPE